MLGPDWTDEERWIAVKDTIWTVIVCGFYLGLMVLIGSIYYH